MDKVTEDVKEEEIKVVIKGVWLKERVIAKAREKETSLIDKILKRKTIFLGLKETKFKENSNETKEKIIDLIKKNKPSRIYTLSSLDPHSYHRAVNNLVMEVINKIKYKGDVYAFEVWNVINEDKPIVYVDISDTFKEKINMLRHFKSQWLSIYIQLIPIIFRAKLYGNKNNCKYAEKFYKLK